MGAAAAGFARAVLILGRRFDASALLFTLVSVPWQRRRAPGSAGWFAFGSRPSPPGTAATTAGLLLPAHVASEDARSQPPSCTDGQAFSSADLPGDGYSAVPPWAQGSSDLGEEKERGRGTDSLASPRIEAGICLLSRSLLQLSDVLRLPALAPGTFVPEGQNSPSKHLRNLANLAQIVTCISVLQTVLFSALRSHRTSPHLVSWHRPC